MALPERIRFYLTHSMAGSPTVLNALLGYFPSNSGFWDYRPDADRFTPREVLAHLAEWDPIFQGRIERMLKEDHPHIPGIDEGQLAIDHSYATQDPGASLARFRDGRVALGRTLGDLQESDLDRTAHREGVGDITVNDMLVMISGHDGYHLRQLSEYLLSWRKI